MREPPATKPAEVGSNFEESPTGGGLVTRARAFAAAWKWRWGEGWGLGSDLWKPQKRDMARFHACQAQLTWSGLVYGIRVSMEKNTMTTSVG